MTRWVPIAAALAVALCPARGATFFEDFSQAPSAPVWRFAGNSSLFAWDSVAKNLRVTWDSAQPNSFCYHLLGTTLARDDDFSFEFDLQLTDIQVGINPSRPYTFQLAVALINTASALAPGLQRGGGVNAAHGARSLVEFDYFPDSGYGATISPTLVSSNNQFAVVFDYPLEIDPGAVFHIILTYSPANSTCHTSITRDGQVFGPIDDVILPAGFSDFRLDAFALCNYSDDGADGSLLAHGTVDNINVRTPSPPVSSIRGVFTNRVWQVSFGSRTNWTYALERTLDFNTWVSVSTNVGTANSAELTDSTILPGACYRVRAWRP